MARALTAGELATLREERQRTDLFLAILVPEVVFTARVDGAHVADRLAVITYDGGSGGGDFGNVLPDMTLYVGSTAGAFNRGMARVRQGNDGNWYEAGSGGGVGGIRIGETSEIEIQDNDYLTIVDEFELWPRPLRILDDGTILMDHEIAYTDQHRYPQPVPVMGPHACAWLPAGGTVGVLFDAGDSWAPIVPGAGYTFLWICAGAVIVGGNTATPTITFNATGTYRVNCQVTADYGGGNTAAFTSHRRVFVFDDANMPLVKFTLDDCSGSWREGGWAFQVTMYDEALLYDPATVTGIRDRALVVLFARDWYGDTEISIGPIQQSGTTVIRGNIVASGWINGESITRNWEAGTVGFEVQGPQHWMGQMVGFPSGLEDTDAPGGAGGVPTDWTQFEDLTVDRGLWHFLHWRSTVTRMMDVQLTGDARQTGYFDAPIGTLWEQLTQVAENVILAYSACDRYGRLFVQVDSQLLPTAARAGIPTVMAFTTQDRRRQVDIQRVTVPPASLVDQAGISYLNGVAGALFSLSPGHVFKHYGQVKKLGRLALTNQVQANDLAGLILSNANNEYPHVDIPLAANNRNLDIAPWQYVTMSIAPGDTERGITWVNKKLVPRQVSFQMRQGMMLADVETEGYTDEVCSTDGDAPPIPPDPPPPPPPPLPPLPDPDVVVIYDRAHILATQSFRQANPIWGNVKGGVSGWITSVKLDTHDGKGAWALTGTDNLDQNDLGVGVGLWRCNDIFAAPPVWNLIFSQADGNANSYPALVCGSGGGQYTAADAWGQLRSMMPCGPGEVFVVETKGTGPIGERAGGMANASTLYKVTAGGGWSIVTNPGWGGQGSGECSAAVDCHAGLGFAETMYWCTHDGFKGCHQVVVHAGGDPLVAGTYMLVDQGVYCRHPAPCPGPVDYLVIGPLGGKPIGAPFNADLFGTRHRTRDGAYCVVFDGLAGAQGHLITSAGVTIDNNIYDNWSFVNITISGSHLYWCKYEPGEPVGVNEVWQSGAALGFNSDDLFGIWGAVGTIGYIGAMPDGKERLFLLRKNQPSLWVGANDDVIYWWTEDMGTTPVNKTGNINLIIDANKWSGTGPREATAQLWNLNYDNVGVCIFGADLP